MGVAVGDQLIGLRIIERQMLEVDLNTAALFDQPHAGGDDVEVLQAEEVDLQQADVPDCLHVVLGDDRLAPGPVLQRGIADKRFGSDHDPGRVRADVA